MAKKKTRKKKAVPFSTVDNTNNKHAEKYTADVVLAMVKEMIEFAQMPKVVQIGKKTRKGGDNDYTETTETTYRPTSITEVCLSQMKTCQWFANMSKKFKKDQRVFESLELLKEIIKNNIIEAAESGAIKGNIALANLARNFDWIPTNKTEHKHDITEALGKLQIIEDDEGFPEQDNNG